MKAIALQTVNIRVNNRVIMLKQGEPCELSYEEYVRIPNGYLEQEESESSPLSDAQPFEGKKKRR
jgi:hypothetical protein